MVTLVKYIHTVNLYLHIVNDYIYIKLIVAFTYSKYYTEIKFRLFLNIRKSKYPDLNYVTIIIIYSSTNFYLHLVRQNLNHHINKHKNQIQLFRPSFISFSKTHKIFSLPKYIRMYDEASK